MRWLVATTLMLALLPAPAQGQSTFIEMTLTAQDSDEIDVSLEADAGKTLRFQASDAAFGLSATQPPQTVALTLVCGCASGAEEITRSMSRTGTNPWQATLAVNAPDLIEGTWTVTARAVRNGVTHATNSGTLEVDAPPGGLVVRALNADPQTGVVSVGAGANVQVSVRLEQPTTAPMVRSVQYKIGNVGPFDWAAPYVLSASNFQPPGPHAMTVVAEDRAGNTAQVSFTVFADTEEPKVTPVTPAVFYRGIPNNVTLVVEEHSSFTATARLGTVQATATGLAGTRTVTLQLTPLVLGEEVLEIVVTDRVGNELRMIEQTAVEPLLADIVLGSAAQTDDGTIPGEPMRMRITASQTDGLVDIPVNVTFDGQVIGSMLVNRTRATTADISFDLQPGRHDGQLVLAVPAHVDEVDLADQTMNITLEKFLARVLYGADRYHIRGDAVGLPREAVAANGTTYPLRLEDRGLGSVYAFTVDGVELYWHPASTTTTVPEQEPEDGDKGIPAPGALLVLLSALAMRRRR